MNIFEGNSGNLNDLSQYYFDRECFAKTVNDIIPNLEDVIFANSTSLATGNFLIYRQDDEFYIIHLASGTIINWYKHLGRTNTCNKNITYGEFKQFLLLLREDFDKWVKLI